MSRKQYRQFAAMLANLRVALSQAESRDTGYEYSEDIGYGRALIDIENVMCTILKADNPRFDAERFRRCGTTAQRHFYTCRLRELTLALWPRAKRNGARYLMGSAAPSAHPPT